MYKEQKTAMSEQELRDKIVEIVINSLWKDAEADYNSTDESEARTIADALIAAGLKFDVNYSLTAAFNSVQIERERDLERRLLAAEHRAEVAEAKLEKYLEKIKYGKLVEPVWFVSFMNDLPCYGRVIGYQEDSGFVMECTECCLISAEEIYLSEEEAQKAAKEKK